MYLNYKITFNIGGTTGNIVSQITGNSSGIEILCPAPDIPTNSSILTQYATINEVKFNIPAFTSVCNISSISLIGTNGSDLTLT